MLLPFHWETYLTFPFVIASHSQFEDFALIVQFLLLFGSPYDMFDSCYAVVNTEGGGLQVAEGYQCKDDGKISPLRFFLCQRETSLLCRVVFVRQSVFLT